MGLLQPLSSGKRLPREKGAKRAWAGVEARTEGIRPASRLGKRLSNSSVWRPAPPRAPAATNCRRARRPAFLLIGNSFELDSIPCGVHPRNDASIPVIALPVHAWRAVTGMSVPQITFGFGARCTQDDSEYSSSQAFERLDRSPAIDAAADCSRIAGTPPKRRSLWRREWDNTHCRREDAESLSQFGRKPFRQNPSYSVCFGTGGVVCGSGALAVGSELYQSISRVKYMAAATARKLAIAPTSNALSSSRSSI